MSAAFEFTFHFLNFSLRICFLILLEVPLLRKNAQNIDNLIAASTFFILILCSLFCDKNSIILALSFYLHTYYSILINFHLFSIGMLTGVLMSKSKSEQQYSNLIIECIFLSGRRHYVTFHPLGIFRHQSLKISFL